MEAFLIFLIVVGIALLLICFVCVFADSLVNDPVGLLCSFTRTRDVLDYIDEHIKSGWPYTKYLYFLFLSGASFVVIPSSYFFVKSFLEDYNDPTPSLEEKIEDAIKELKETEQAH